MNEQLLQLLIRQQQTSSQLLTVLEQESQAVLNGDVAQLQQVGQAKEACCQAISQMEESWPTAMRNADARSWITQQGQAMSQAWDSLVEQLRRCRRQNDANGLLIAERQQWVTQQLSPVSTQTYGAAGQAGQTSSSTWATSV